MTRAIPGLVLLCAAAGGVALAHSAPNSLVKLDFLAHTVRAEVLVPESELAFATAADRSPIILEAGTEPYISTSRASR